MRFWFPKFVAFDFQNETDIDVISIHVKKKWIWNVWAFSLANLFEKSRILACEK